MWPEDNPRREALDEEFFDLGAHGAFAHCAHPGGIIVLAQRHLGAGDADAPGVLAAVPARPAGVVESTEVSADRRDHQPRLLLDFAVQRRNQVRIRGLDLARREFPGTASEVVRHPPEQENAVTVADHRADDLVGDTVSGVLLSDRRELGAAHPWSSLSSA